MKNPVVWFEIYVDDMKRAVQFYETVLGTKLEKIDDPSNQEVGMEMMRFGGDMETHGTSGMLVKMEGMSAGGNSTLVYFHSEDCVSEESRVVDAGGKVMKPKMSIGEYGFMSLCVDTEGNAFGLHSMK
jgi:predicted enzyme related to lactoylglutathione lyase